MTRKAFTLPAIAALLLCLLSSPCRGGERPDTSLSRDYIGAQVSVQSVLLFGQKYPKWSLFDDYQNLASYRVQYGRQVNDRWRLTAGVSFAQGLPKSIMYLSYPGQLVRETVTILGLPLMAELNLQEPEKRVQPFLLAGLTPAIGLIRDKHYTVWDDSAEYEGTKRGAAFLLSAVIGAGSRLRFADRWEAQGAATLSSGLLNARITGPQPFAIPPYGYKSHSFLAHLLGLRVGVNYVLR